MDWSEAERRQPQLAAVGREHLIQPGVVLVVTIRKDGTPRLSPVEPLILDGTFWLAMMLGSTKARDLQRDPRILVHSIVTGREGEEGEFKVRGTAHEEPGRTAQEHYAEAVASSLGWDPVPGRFHLFGVDIEHITFMRYHNATGDQVTTMWPPGREFVRRGTTPTEVGEPEPRTELLVPDNGLRP